MKIWPALITTTTMVLSGCDFGKTTFGGSRNYDSAYLAETLLTSASLAVEIDQTSVVYNGLNFAQIRNRPEAKPTNFLLTPDQADLGSMSGDWLRVRASTPNTFFSGVFDSALLLKSPTIIAVVEPGVVGDILSVNPGTRDAGAFQIRADAGTIEASYLSTLTDRSLITLAKPAGSKLLIAVSFGTLPSTTLLSLNGVLSDNRSVVGSPTEPSNAYHLLQLGSSNAAENFDFKRLYVFSRSLTPSELGSMIAHVASLEGISVSLDPRLAFTGASEEPVTSLFTAAHEVVKTNCSSCHSELTSLSASGYVNLGFVVPGNPNASKLFYRLRGSSGGGGPKTMPPSNSLSQSDLDKVSAWISSLQ